MEDPRVDSILRELQIQGEAERKKERSLANARKTVFLSALVAIGCLAGLYAGSRKMDAVRIVPPPRTAEPAAPGERPAGAAPAAQQTARPAAPQRELPWWQRPKAMLVLSSILVIDVLVLVFAIRWMTRLMIGAPPPRRDISL